MMSPMNKWIRPRPNRKERKSICFLRTQSLGRSVRPRLSKSKRSPNDLEFQGDMMKVFRVSLVRRPNRFRIPRQTALVLECFAPFFDPESALYVADSVGTTTCVEGSVRKEPVCDNIRWNFVDSSLSFGVLVLC